MIFVLGLPRLLTSSIFREFPCLMITSFHQLKDRIFEFEEGSWKHPLEELQEIVYMSGTILSDSIRKDMSLPIKAENITLITNKNA